MLLLLCLVAFPFGFDVVVDCHILFVDWVLLVWGGGGGDSCRQLKAETKSQIHLLRFTQTNNRRLHAQNRSGTRRCVHVTSD